MQQLVSHYEVLQKLGEGGMGVVYKAVDNTLGRVVALKFLSADRMNAREVARFEDEARAISTLNHPHIATIYEFGQAAGNRFLVLEYLPGGTLGEVLRRLASSGERLRFENLLDYALQIAEGLAHAHRHGIIHRDVKCENVMLTEEGTLKITDFGLAKLRAAETGGTRPGTVAGTVGCMSPEQALGEGLDKRSDIFSFGVLLYHMATGQMPFRGPHALAVMQEILHAPPPPLDQLRPDLPQAFQAVMEKALSKDRNERYQTMEEVLADLEALRRRSDQSTLTLSLPAPKGMARGRIWAWGAGAAMLACLLALVWSLLPNRLVEQHIAVLPFQNIGGGPDGQAFCDGVTESLTSKLSQLQRFQKTLWVVPSSELRAQPVSSASQARQVFGATLVITGSMQRMGTAIRVITNLIDATTRKQLESRTVETRLDNITELQDAAIARVTEMLQLELDPEARRALAQGKTTVTAAYQAYEEGHGYLRSEEAAEVDRAIELFQLAIEKDLTYASAYAELGEAFMRKYSATKDPQWMKKAFEACTRAVELNDTLAPVHLAMAHVYAVTGKYPQALNELQRMLALDPAGGEVHHLLAEVYEDMGKLREAEATYKQLIDLQPSYWSGYNELGVFYFGQGEYAKAEPLFRKVNALAPRNVLGYSNLGGLYSSMGRYTEAIAALKVSLEIKPSARAYSNLGTIDYFLGRYADAVPMMERAVELSPMDHRLWGNLGDACRWAPAFRDKAAPSYRRAIELTDKQLEINPRDPVLLASVAVWRAKLGETKAALAGITQALEYSHGSGSLTFASALVYELCGQRDRALAALKAALEAGYSAEEIRNEPELANLRRDPRYAKLAGQQVSGVSPRQP